MRKYFLLFILFLFISGCDEGNLDSETYTDIDDGYISEQCCSATYSTTISGVSPTGGSFYWVVLLNVDSMVIYGEPLFIPEGSFSNIELEVTVSYLDNIAEGNYMKSVYSSISNEDVGKISKRNTAAISKEIQIQEFINAQCGNCCTHRKDSAGRDSRYKCFAMQQFTAVYGIQGKIKTKYGKLCAEGHTSSDTLSASTKVFVGLQENITGLTAGYFCQIGYENTRFAGSISRNVYIEISPVDSANIYIFAEMPNTSTPVNNTSYTYSVRSNGSLGTVTFKFEQESFNLVAPLWAGKIITNAGTQGEIDARESDMPGLSSDPCIVEDIAYWFNSTSTFPTNATFTSQDLIGVTQQSGNRPQEWGIYVLNNGNVVEFWDINPL